MVIVAPSADDRELLISRLAVRLGFAKVPSDAKKIIRKDIYSVDLATAYFVLCSNYSFAVLSSLPKGCMSLPQGVFVL